MKTSAPSSIALGKQVILDEATALRELAESLDDSFSNAVHTLLELSEVGRIVISGMGKGGFIGMKISATFASIGAPSFFLHPAEAVHGDLGRFTKHDVALLLSNSGETEEIVTLLPFIKRVGCPVIGVTAGEDSTLGRAADVVLSLGKHREAGPLGLAPTTSTTAMLAIGDALAMSLLESKGLSEQDFAGFHPAGSLGRSLLQVQEVMRSGDELCTVSPETSCSDVIRAITDTKGRPGAAVVVNDTGELVGIFTDGNLRRCLYSGEQFLSDPVKTHMGENPKSIGPEKLIREATALMTEKRIDQIVVVDRKNRPLGLVDIQDAVSARAR